MNALRSECGNDLTIESEDLEMSITEESLEKLKDAFEAVLVISWEFYVLGDTEKMTHGALQPESISWKLNDLFNNGSISAKGCICLAEKGILAKEKVHHIVLIYRNINEDLSKIRTRLSQGSHPKELSDYLVLKMAKLANPHRKQFEQFVWCVISQTKYVEI